MVPVPRGAERSKLVRPIARITLTSLWGESGTGILRRMAESRRLYEQIAQQLASAIASAEYEVGQRLPSERELAQQFGVSRPTVREAIIALELDELVEVRTGSGVYVTNREPPSGQTGFKD